MDWATPDTPMRVSSVVESHLSRNSYFTDLGRHLHFTWNSEEISLHKPLDYGRKPDENFYYDIDATDLPPVVIGNGRYSKEGVAYRQLYTSNRNGLRFRIDGDQFGFIKRNALGYPHVFQVAPQFEFIVEYERDCPDGSLVELKWFNGEMTGKLVKGPQGRKKSGATVCCGQPHVCGQPATAPVAQSASSALENRIVKNVKGFMKRVTGKNGKNKDRHQTCDD